MSHARGAGIGGSWWAFALRGLVGVLFGLLFVVWPGLALSALPLLVTLLGLYILIDGVVTVVSAMRSPERRRWLLLVEGILVILAGLVALIQPGVAALAVLYVLAAWAVLSSLSKIAPALRGRTGHEWLMLTNGAISVIFGIVLVLLPGAGTHALVWTAGLYAIATGAAG